MAKLVRGLLGLGCGDVAADLLGEAGELQELVGLLGLGLRLAGHEVTLLVPARRGHASHLLEVGGDLLGGLDDRLLDRLAEGAFERRLHELTVDVGTPGLELRGQSELPGLLPRPLVLVALGQGVALGVRAVLEVLELHLLAGGLDLELVLLSDHRHLPIGTSYHV